MVEITSDYQEKYMSFLMRGLIIFCLCYLIGTLFEDAPTILRIIQITGIVMFFWSITKIGSFSNFDSNYFKIVISLLICYHLFVVLKNYSLSDNYLKTYLREPYYFLQFFVPLVVLLSPFFFTEIFSKYSRYLCYVFFILLPFAFIPIFNNQDFSEQFVWACGTGAGFLLMNSIYFKRKTNILSFLTIAGCLLISTIMARRSIMLTFFGYLVSALLIYIYTSQINLKKKIMVLLFFFFACVAGYYFFMQNQSNLFGGITERAKEDSREVVYLFYWEDMNGKDWIWGKGMNGTYYAPYIDKESPVKGEDEDLRQLIEGGYLQIILKGGIVNLALFLFLAIPALINGIFYSNNVLSKAAGALIFLRLIDMFPWGMPAFNVGYVMFWLCVSICLNKKIRNYTDEEIEEQCFATLNKETTQ
jgi:hypothetical protein